MQDELYEGFTLEDEEELDNTPTGEGADEDEEEDDEEEATTTDEEAL